MMTHNKKIRKRAFRRQATDFVVWRAGNNLGWKCTLIELAEQSGLDKATVHLVLNRRGWFDRVIKVPPIGRTGKHDLVEIMTHQVTSGDYSFMGEQ